VVLNECNRDFSPIDRFLRHETPRRLHIQRDSLLGLILLFLANVAADSPCMTSTANCWPIDEPRLFLGESASPDIATRGRNKDDLIGTLKDDEMPAAVDTSNRHGGRSGAV
jgi:hypothetical protein